MRAPTCRSAGRAVAGQIGPAQVPFRAAGIRTLVSGIRPPRPGAGRPQVEKARTQTGGATVVAWMVLARQDPERDQERTVELAR